MAHNAGGPGVSQEEHLGPRGFPPDVSAGRSGAVQAAGAAQTWDGGQGKNVEQKNPKDLIYGQRIG